VERDDADLVQAVLGGDVGAFEALVGRYQRAVYGLAYSVCSDWSAAHDLTQDTFLQAYLELPRLEDPARFAGWLRRIAFRTSLNHLRARKARREDLEALDDVQPLLAAPEPEDPRVVQETGSALRAAIEALPSRYRIPLVMHHVRGLAQERVAHFLGVPEGTVKSLLSRARKLLREALEPQIEEGLQMTDDALAGQALPDDFAETLGALIRACSDGDLPALERLLEEHPTLINARHRRFERSPLHFAAIHGRRPVVQLLLQRGASATQRDHGDNAYALHFAAEQGQLEIVKLLVEAGADVHGTGDGHGLDVIGWATCFQHTRREVAEYLLSRGARQTIFSASALGDVAAIREIVRADAAQLERRLTEHDARRSPLHLAVLKGQRAAVEVLAELGADLEAKDARGRTPLELALLWRRREVAECLKKLGARAPQGGLVTPAVTHVVPILRVKDVAASLDYYRQRLGFENGSTWGEPPVWGGCNRDGIGVYFSVHQGHPGSWLALSVENVDALHEEYRARGARILSAPQDTPWGLREMRVEDPDGNVLRISSEPAYDSAE
jgi:RNA polymerase sigma factor (sigma-70 family)